MTMVLSFGQQKGNLQHQDQTSLLCLSHTYVPTAVERGDLNQNRRHGVVFDDDGYSQVGCSQSAQDAVGGQRQQLL